MSTVGALTLSREPACTASLQVPVTPLLGDGPDCSVSVEQTTPVVIVQFDDVDGDDTDFQRDVYEKVMHNSSRELRTKH